MIHGITIQLAVKTQTGTDSLNRPIFEETMVEVEDVLVGEPSHDDVTGTIELYGKRAAYTLGIPKGDSNKWEDATVILPEPFAGKYRTIGFPIAGIEANIPLRWNKKVMVEQYG